MDCDAVFGAFQRTKLVCRHLLYLYWIARWRDNVRWNRRKFRKFFKNPWRKCLCARLRAFTGSLWIKFHQIFVAIWDHWDIYVECSMTASGAKSGRQLKFVHTKNRYIEYTFKPTFDAVVYWKLCTHVKIFYGAPWRRQRIPTNFKVRFFGNFQNIFLCSLGHFGVI